MSDATPADSRERELRLRYAGDCRDCGTTLAAGTRARWDPVRRTTRCRVCPAAGGESFEPAAHASAAGHQAHGTSWGAAGASAQRQFERQQGRRHARLRAHWVAVSVISLLGAAGGGVLGAKLHMPVALFVLLGATFPVLKVLATPQHIDAWRSGAAGEREVGARLDKLRTTGVLTLHDRRVPGRRTNIDHIAVCPTGVFVIDTKNVAGKVSATRDGLRVAGRRRDGMITGVRRQVDVVRQALEDQAVSPDAVRGVLCFTRAELPWLATAPQGVALLGPRGLARALRRPGRLSEDQVNHLATVLARRLPVA